MAAAVDADQLILLTDVDRLFGDPRLVADARPMFDVHHPRELDALQAVAGDGGFGAAVTTKLAAARIATASGITVHLADGVIPPGSVRCCRGSEAARCFIPIRNRWATGAVGWPMLCSPRGPSRWMPGPVMRCIGAVRPC